MQIPYTYQFRKQLWIAAILGFIVAFIMVFLEPFDTYQFESNYKYLILLGFGFLQSILYLMNARLENLWYRYENRRWKIKHEIASFLFLLFVSAIVIHFYNQVFLNDFFNHQYGQYEYVKHSLWFFRKAILPVILLILPFYVYLRNKFGEMITDKPASKIELWGKNKGEKILIQKEAILFVKASENYVEIFYKKGGAIQHETLRNTLTAINKQTPFLHQCHRSYLVNISAIKSVKGNSQNAKITFDHDGLDIPLSKSYYKTIKLTLST